jgi:lysophospholipase L1-like esterase
MPTKRDVRSSLKIGKAMAEVALKQQRKATLTRKRALAELLKKAPKAEAAPVAAIAPMAAVSAGVLIAEGDSWFDYPLNDVLSMLDELHGYDVESVSHRGDSVEEMAYGGGQLRAFASRVEKVLRTGTKPKAILLSGGGNDVAGDEFAMLLNHAVSGRPGLNDSIVTGVVDERVHDAYATILQAITQVCQGLIGQTVPIIVHGYAYAVPDGRGFLGGFWFLPGPWLEPGFRQKGYEKMADRKPIVISIIDRFNAMLARLTSHPQFSHVKHVDLRGVLSNGSNYKSDWDNELHPTPNGFKKVAQKFKDAIG